MLTFSIVFVTLLTKGGSINYDELMDSDDEGNHDAYLEQMKQEGREKEDDDEDFNINDDSDESGKWWRTQRLVSQT